MIAPPNEAVPRRAPVRPRHVAVGLAGVVALFLVVRLMVAPVTLPVAGWVERALQARLGGAVDVGRVGLRLGPDRIVVVLSDVRLRTEAAAGSISRLRLVQGWSERRLEVVAPVFTVPQRAAPLTTLPRPGSALAALDAAIGRAAAGADAAGVRSVAVTDGRLTLVEPGGAVTAVRIFQDVNATVEVRESGAVAGTAGAVGTAGRIALQVSRAADATGSRLSFSADGVAPGDLAPARAVRAGLALTPTLDLRVGPDGTVREAAAALSIGTGTVVLGTDPPRTLDRADVRVRLDPARDVIVLEEAAVDAGGTRVVLAGEVRPGADPAAPWTFALSAPEAVLDSPDVDGAPVAVGSAEVEGRIDARATTIFVDRLRVAAPTARIDAVLAFDWSRPTLSGSVHVGSSTATTLAEAWPPTLAFDPRRAVLSTVLGGVLQRADIDLALTPLELDGDPATSDMIEGAVRVDAEFLDATLTGPELPVAIQRAAGAVRMVDRQLSVRLDGGTLPTSGGGELAITEAFLTIPSVADKPPVAEISATVRGPLSAVVALANRLELPQLKETPLAPEDVTGEVEAKVAAAVPLADPFRAEDVLWSVDARLTNAGSRVPIEGQTWGNANIEVLVNPRRLAARGRATVDGLTVDVNYSELFAGERSGGARFVLTDKDRRDRGFDTGTMLRGPVVVTLDAGGGAPAAPAPAEGVEADPAAAAPPPAERAFTADLTEASVDLPGFAKDAGDRLSVEGVLVGAPADLLVDRVRVEGAGAKLAGTVRLAAGEFSAATFDTFALTEGDDARVAVERQESAYRIAVEGERFDARKVVSHLKRAEGRSDEGEREGGGPGLIVSADVDEVVLLGETVVADLSVDARQSGGRVQRLSVAGRTGANAPFGVQVAPDGPVRRVRADVADLGRALAGLGLYERMVGGRATLDATLDGSGTLVGRLVASDFALRNERALDDIQTQTIAFNSANDESARTLSYQPEGQAADERRFDLLVVDFEKRGDVITVREAILRGPVVGGTAEGALDLAGKTVRLNGTFIPAYGVNNLFGRVPVVGQLLGGGNKGGLIGVTFRLNGPIAEPALSINPISAIAPGIFRRIFEFR